MFIPIQSKEGWRIRTNYKLQKLIKGGNIVKIIQTKRMKWWGHLNRMEGIKLVEKITDLKRVGIRTKGRPKNRWRDAVINGLKKLKLRNWRQLVRL
jgi:hypothetical protein